MNIFEPGVSAQVSAEQKRRLLSVMHSRNAFRVTREANVYEASHALPACIAKATPLLDSNVDQCRWFNDVEYAAEWLLTETANGDDPPHSSRRRTPSGTAFSPKVDELLEVTGEIRGESTGIRMRLSSLGLKA